MKPIFVGLITVLLLWISPLAQEQVTKPKEDGRQNSSEDRQNSLPSSPGIYCETTDGIKPLSSAFSEKENWLVLPSKLPPLVVIYPKESVHVEGLRVASGSGASLTLGTSGGGVGFNDLIAPDRIEPIPGSDNAFRVRFNQKLQQDMYLLVSKYLDKKDGKEKVMIHQFFRVIYQPTIDFQDVRYIVKLPNQKDGRAVDGWFIVDPEAKELLFRPVSGFHGTSIGNPLFSIPYDAITRLLYAEKNRYLTIQHNDANGPGADAIVRLDKKNFQNCLSTLEAQTGKKIEHTEKK